MCHVIVNRVDAESGKAAGLSKSKLRLSKWAEGYEQGQGRIRCSRRVTRNARRGRGERVRDWVSVSTGRHRREKMNPHQEPRSLPAAGVSERERERVALGKAHFEEVRAIELGAGEAYRSGMEGSEERAEVAARTGGWGAHIRYDPPVDH